MDSHCKAHFTLKELTNIALGSEKISGVNTIVLHTLLNLVLKKLNCEHEKVTIDGYDAIQMDRMLQASTISPIIFNLENFKVILKDYENLDQMQKRLEETEVKLNEHLIGIRKYLKRLEELVPCRFNDDDYYELCEDLCSTNDPEIKDACDTLSKSAFLRKILIRLCYPIISTYFNLEARIAVLEKEICELMKRLDTKFNVYNLIDALSDDFDWCCLQFDNLHENFLNALNEIQDILDAKVNKYQMLQLKEYIAERYDSIWEQLNKLLLEGKCQRAAAILFEDGGEKSEEGKKATKKSRKTCECDGVHLYAAREQKLLDRIKRIDTKRVQVLLETKGRRSCYTPYTPYF